MRIPEAGPIVSWSHGDGSVLYFAIEARRFDQDVFHLLRREPLFSFQVHPLGELERGVPYMLRVRAVNAAGSSAPSHEVPVYWPHDLPPAAEAEVIDPCGTEDPETLCLSDDEFRVRVAWRDPRSGRSGRATAGPLPANDCTGTFWFFRPDNVELVAKVLDGTPVNGHHWVFWGSLTDVEYDLRVVDAEAGVERSYHNPPGNVCGGADTAAFGQEQAKAQRRS